jgi:hypothetical protein
MTYTSKIGVRKSGGLLDDPGTDSQQDHYSASQALLQFPVE